ncbi:MAG: GAF domain-containing protein [Terriglobales bacterium]
MPDPGAPRLHNERRRTTRQRLHTPVYVSFNTPQSGSVVDLSELLDLNEHGFAVQTAIPAGLHKSDQLEVSRAVSLCLDLPETRQYVHGSGQVMWTDSTGRAGIRFSFLPDPSRRALKEWLFANLLVASTNYTARLRQLELHRHTRQAEWAAQPLVPPQETWPPNRVPEQHGFRQTASEQSVPPPRPVQESRASVAPFLGAQRELSQPTFRPMSDPDPIPRWHASPAGPSAIQDRTEILLALDDVRRQIREILDRAESAEAEDARQQAQRGDYQTAAGFAEALQRITEHAAALTGASGAALALRAADRFAADSPVGDVPVEDLPVQDSPVEEKIICRASVGDPAPPPGSEVDVKSGLSGECLRTGAIVSCADTESDPRVDPEICRALGIGSFMAAPIFADFRVVGLIEIFSPYPHSFASTHETVLERLAELVPRGENENNLNKESAIEGKSKSKSNDSSERSAAPPAATLAIPSERHESEQHDSERDEDEPAAIDASAETKPEIAPARESIAVAEPVELEIRHDPAGSQQNQPAAFYETEDLPKPAPNTLRRVPTSHLVLLVSAIAVAAMALGYLLAPTIEQHWLRPAQAAQAATPPVAVDRRGHALSPDDVRKLAEQGDADAEWQLGILYHNGDGVPKDDAIAVQWFERAAEQGYVNAQSTLGAYYEAGRGVPQDFSKAYTWSVLALAQGDENSKFRLQDLAARMTQPQVSAARQQAEVWLRAHNQTANSKPK